MIHWWLAPFLITSMGLVTTFWIATSRQPYCEILAAGFALTCALPVIFLWWFFYMLSLIL